MSSAPADRQTGEIPLTSMALGRSLRAHACRSPARSRVAVLCAGLMCVSCILVACGTRAAGLAPGAATRTALTSARATMTATATATPVRLAAMVTPSGTVAARDVRLAVTVTFTNMTTAPIYMANLVCQRPIIHVELRLPGTSPSSSALWQNWGGGQCLRASGCSTVTAPNTLGPEVLVGDELAPGATSTWTTTGDLSQVSGLTQPGPYLFAVMTGWLAFSPAWSPNICNTSGYNPPLPTFSTVDSAETIPLT